MRNLPPGQPGSPHGSHVLLPVPWDKASSIRNRLRKRGITAVACYDPQHRRATIEISQDTDLLTIQDLLGGTPR
jgi:hypothetical protein